MPDVCLYLQVLHQPFRLAEVRTVFDTDPSYFDHALNAKAGEADRGEFLSAADAHCCWNCGNSTQGKFLSGDFLTLVRGRRSSSWSCIRRKCCTICMRARRRRGRWSFSGETYFHSQALRCFRNRNSWSRWNLHPADGDRSGCSTRRRRRFRNTEKPIYSDEIAKLAAELGFTRVLAEGWEPVLNNRSAAFLYRTAGAPLALLLRNHQLSDAIAFRFSDARSPDFPLTDEKFVWHEVEQIGGQLCNLFMDAETFGEHHAAGDGDPDFLQVVSEEAASAACRIQVAGREIKVRARRQGRWRCRTRFPGRIRRGTWGRGWAMRCRRMRWMRCINLETMVKGHANLKLLGGLAWRLTTSAIMRITHVDEAQRLDGRVHAGFRPYDSPYDAYINFL